MGWNTFLIVLNDALGGIEKDEHFGAKVSRAARASFGPEREDRSDRYNRNIGSGGHGNAATAFHSAHADTVALALLGGNMAKVLGEVHNMGRFHDPEDEREVLRRILGDLGYQLRGRRKESSSLSVVEKVGRLQDEEDMRGRLLALETENERLRRRLAELETNAGA